MKKIILGFDGVIVDSIPYYVQAVRYILSTYSNFGDKNNCIQDISFLDSNSIARDLIKKYGINEDKEILVKTIREYVIKAYDDVSIVKESAIETISELHDNGYSVNILTATPHELIDPCLKKLGVYDLFDNIWTCEDLGYKKDDVNAFYEVVKILETTVDNCVYADDNVISLTMAKKANMEVVGVFDRASSRFSRELKKLCDGYVYQLREILLTIYGKKYESVNEYIKFNWDSVVRVRRKDRERYVGLPYPFTVPAVGYFETLFYWDTYFTNVGLIIDGRGLLAKNNTDNILYLVDKYGFMPNSNARDHFDHSQPPFLSVMVRDVYEYFGDKLWLRGAYETLKREYDFWMTQRSTPIGLNRYDTNITDQKDLATRAAEYEGRIQRNLIEYDPADIGRNYLATCESGYDSSSRFEFDIYNYAPVCLNSLLYGMEINMSFFANELCESSEEALLWMERAKTRKELMNRYMLDEKGVFKDYNYITGKLSCDFSCASVYPLAFGLADESNASDFMASFERLETAYGVLANEKNNFEGNYQWGYPNGWAPHQMLVIQGLDKYGYTDKAACIAMKYIKLVDTVFAKTQSLWEKYNVLEGSDDVIGESRNSMPPMMGWTAGAYLHAQNYLESMENKKK